MQFSTALVAIFASIAFAAGPMGGPAMASASADAKAPGVTDAAKGAGNAAKGTPDGVSFCSILHRWYR